MWQSEDGHLGVLMANYVNEEIPFAWRIDPSRYGLKGGRYKLVEVTPEGVSDLGRMSGTIQRTENSDRAACR